MLHTIENDQLICTIESVGAEIRSLKNKITGEEYIWQIDSAIWGSSSPVLFPAIGRIKGDKILFKGKEYAMPKHGIVRNNDQLKYKPIDKTSCSFTLNSSEETLKQYPFNFSFVVEYSLVENLLKMTYHVENKDDVEMSFTCGGHTAYACPLSKDTKLNDYVIEFPTQLNLETIPLADSKMLTHDKRKVEILDKTLTLTENLFNDDALVFENITCDWVRLRKKSQDKGIVVKFNGYPNLAIWSKPGADYVCIEPWLGLPDRIDESLDITNKSTYNKMAPKTYYSISIETIIEE